MYRSLQACRAIAAVLVVLFHLGGTFAQDRYFGFKALDGPFAWADAGVDFFFVLSGFLITFTHRWDFGRPQALGRYLLKRTLRIYPTYWLICLSVGVATLVVPSLRESLPGSALVFLKALALLPQDPAIVGGTGAPILFVAWSLQYEMLFYAVIAVFILSRSTGLVVVAGLVSINLTCHFSETCGFPFSFISNNLILLFGMGVGCAYLVRSRFRVPNPIATALVAAVAFVAFGAFEVGYGREQLPIDRRLVYGVLGSVIVLALAQAEDAGRLPWLGRRWIARLGDSSYSLYLLHIPIISLLCKGILKLGVTNPIALVAMFFLVVLACVGASVLFYMAIERPMLEMLRSKKHHADRAEPDQRRDPVLTITRPGFGTLPGALDSRFADARGRRSHDVRWQ